MYSYSSIDISTKRNKGRSDFCFAIAFGLINTISLTLLISSIGFFFGATVSEWNFPLSFISAILANYRLCKSFGTEQARNFFLSSTVIISIIIIISILISGLIYDTSADGLVYHQEAVYQLRNGWNPFFKTLPDSVSQSIWINHYPKGAEIPQSAIYGITNRIETGKATNIFLLTATFFLVISALFRIKKISIGLALLLSFLFTFNPVSINQLFTFYVDGQVANLLLCFLAISILFTSTHNSYCLFLLASIIIITANLKFTALVFSLIFSSGFIIYLYFINSVQKAKKVLFACLIGGLVGVFITGFNPYIKNTVDFNHPFYPLMGKGSIDIIKESYPIGFAEKGNLDKFFISLFSHTDNEGSWSWAERKPILKVPFSINKIDINNARAEDTRIAGFGPLYSGILILSFILFILTWFYQKNNTQVYWKILYTVIIILISVFVIPEAWWARYVPQFWLIPLLMVVSLDLDNRVFKLFRTALYFLIIINISLALLSIPYKVLASSQLQYQLMQFKASGKVIDVSWGNARSNRIRFAEKGIPYRETNITKTPSVEIVGSDSKAIMPWGVPEIKRPLYLRWWRRLKPSD